MNYIPLLWHNGMRQLANVISRDADGGSVLVMDLVHLSITRCGEFVANGVTVWPYSLFH